MLHLGPRALLTRISTMSYGANSNSRQKEQEYS